MDNKYQEIINKNPKKSLDRSINTKQAWMKYRNNFKSGMKRRKDIDRLTNNDEDKFGFKEKTKRDYQCSSLYHDITIMYSNHIDATHAKCYSSNGEYIGTIVLGNFPKDIDLLKIEQISTNHLITEQELIQNSLTQLYEDFNKYYRGMILIPSNLELEEFYKSLGFEYYIKTDDGNKYYRKLW